MFEEQTPHPEHDPDVTKLQKVPVTENLEKSNKCPWHKEKPYRRLNQKSSESYLRDFPSSDGRNTFPFSPNQVIGFVAHRRRFLPQYLGTHEVLELIIPLRHWDEVASRQEPHRKRADLAMFTYACAMASTTVTSLTINLGPTQEVDDVIANIRKRLVQAIKDDAHRRRAVLLTKEEIDEKLVYVLVFLPRDHKTGKPFRHIHVAFPNIVDEFEPAGRVLKELSNERRGYHVKFGEPAANWYAYADLNFRGGGGTVSACRRTRERARLLRAGPPPDVHRDGGEPVEARIAAEHPIAYLFKLIKADPKMFSRLQQPLTRLAADAGKLGEQGVIDGLVQLILDDRRKHRLSFKAKSVTDKDDDDLRFDDDLGDPGSDRLMVA